MKVALLFPPQGHFTQPYLSLPSLTAWLKQNGIEDVHQLDVNIDSYDYFLSEERLRRSLDRIDAKGQLEALDAKEELVFSDMERYQTLSEIALTGERVAETIEAAKKVLRSSEEFYDYERYLWAGRTMEQALRIFSAEYAPTKLTAHGFVMRHRIERSQEIVEAISCEEENPYLEYFREHTLPQLQEIDPDLIGISLTFPSQAIPTLTLCRLIKEWKPSVHITIGGGLLAYTAKKLAKRPELWSLVDTLVMLEGERPLLQLCEHVEGKRELKDVSNIMYCDADGEVQSTPQETPLNIATLPTPDFDGLPLEKYFSPELVLPLAATRGCYWGKCVFCTLYTVIGPGYRGRSIEQTVEDMQKLQDRYGVRNFYLAIEDLPPDMARAFPRAILDAGLDVNWWCDARLEHKVFDEQVVRDLKDSGCVRIAYGYESASRRVLGRMCKGIDPDESMELIKRTHEAGISVTLYAMIGFPTETREEAELTLQTILDHQQYIQEVSVRVFYLDERSEIFGRREEFDIVEIYPDPDADLQVYYDFKCKSGMSRSEARQVYLKFTEALRSHFPVFQNTNMLYHELKSHYFLYLVKHGSWDALKENVLEPSAGPATSQVSGTPQRQEDLVELPLAFDRSILDDIVTSIDSATIRPRYQSDLLEDEDRDRFDRELPPLARAESTLVYNARTGEVQCLSPATADLLARCDGKRSIEEVVEVFPEEVRDQAKQAITAISQAGLLAVVPPRH